MGVKPKGKRVDARGKKIKKKKKAEVPKKPRPPKNKLKYSKEGRELLKGKKHPFRAFDYSRPAQAISSETAPQSEQAEDPDAPVLSRKDLRKQAQGKSPTKTLATDSASLPSPVQQQQERSKHGIWIGNLNFRTSQTELKDWLANHLITANGNITRVHMSAGPNGENNKGWAYVDFDNADITAKAVQLSEQNLNGRRLLIKQASDFGGRPSKEGQANPSLTHQIATIVESYDGANYANSGLGKREKKIADKQKLPPCPTLFLGNLPLTTTGTDLQKMIESHHQKPITNGKATAASDGEEEAVLNEVTPNIADESPAGIKKVRVGTFEDSGKCKGWAFIDFATVQYSTMALLNPNNHIFNKREIVVEYASEEAARRGNLNKSVAMSEPSPGKESVEKKQKDKGKRKFQELQEEDQPAVEKSDDFISIESEAALAKTERKKAKRAKKADTLEKSAQNVPSESTEPVSKKEKKKKDKTKKQLGEVGEETSNDTPVLAEIESTVAEKAETKRAKRPKTKAVEEDLPSSMFTIDVEPSKAPEVEAANPTSKPEKPLKKHKPTKEERVQLKRDKKAAKAEKKAAKKTKSSTAIAGADKSKAGPKRYFD